jgi:CRISPR/Cas system-associated exonuclease Cas4 (RecB family)
LGIDLNQNVNQNSDSNVNSNSNRDSKVISGSGSVAEALASAIKAALRYEADIEKPTMGIYRPSLLPSCLRRQWLIYKKGLPISEEKAGIFRIGELFHGFLSQAFRSSGLNVRAEEAPFMIVLLSEAGEEEPKPKPKPELEPGLELGLRISGRADLILAIDGEAYVIEAKSIRRLPSEPLRHHVAQLQLYLAGLGLRRGFLVYLDKEALRHAVFPVEYDASLLKGILERARRLHEALLSDRSPEPDGEPWECGYCEFRAYCRPPRRRDEGGKGEGEGEKGRKESLRDALEAFGDSIRPRHSHGIGSQKMEAKSRNGF